MQPEERLNNWNLHDSVRGWFGRALYEQMSRNEQVWILTGDLGFGLLDAHKEDFPDRFVNVGASEQLLLGAGIGLALEGKIPFLYSITTFLLYRPIEWMRNYVNHERIPVRLVGSGMGKDYAHDGISHQPSENELSIYFHGMMKNVETHFPGDKTEVPSMVDKMVMRDHPSFICLRR